MGHKPRRQPDTTAETFPFIGAGEAQYFEWAEVHVLFARPPTASERSAIAKAVPPPLQDMVEFSKAHLLVASEQGVGRWIHASYGARPSAPTALTTTSRFKIASSGRVRKFNADIERWLRRANDITPIVVAFRRQDLEAGGTALSAWHQRSVESAPSWLAKVADRGPTKTMRDGIDAELEAGAADRPSADELADDINSAMLNMKSDPSSAARARKLVDELADAEACWLTARETADDISCWRGDERFAYPPLWQLAHRIFSKTLTASTHEQHRAGFQFIADDGFPDWQLDRLIAVALEAALRCGDPTAFARVARSIGTSGEGRREIERCAEALDEDKLEDAARQMRALL